MEFSKEAGGRLIAPNVTRFRVWAPRVDTVSVCIQTSAKERIIPLFADSEGYFQAEVDDCPAGTKYFYQLNNQSRRPDPNSNFQPGGVHGPSEVIDHQAFVWSDHTWRGIAKEDLVIYELHLGCLTEEGTYLAAINQLDRYIELGVNAIELLPLAQTPGRWNWGYDGVNLFSPNCNYGTPDELKALIDACHQKGLAVILDVVYNHLGPEGNYLSEFGPYFSAKHHTPWGDAFNYDDIDCETVRDYINQNVIYWLEHFHLDGLRLDAVHLMIDDSKTHILESLCATVADYKKTCSREIHLIAESNIFDAELLSYHSGNLKYDAAWADCLMHSIYAQGRPDLQLCHRHYTAADLTQALNHGFVYSGRDDHRATPEDYQIANQIEAWPHFVTALQTHDGVGNHPEGKRVHQLCNKDFQKAAAALTLLLPSIPMIFMGEEIASEACFPFFADFEDQHLRQAVDHGRMKEYPQHDWSHSSLPSEEETYYSSKLSRTSSDAEMFTWYQALLRLRRKLKTVGLLTAKNMKVFHDPETKTFELHYQSKKDHIVVSACLATSVINKSDYIHSAFVGKVILSSMNLSETNQDADHPLLSSYAIIIQKE